MCDEAYPVIARLAAPSAPSPFIGYRPRLEGRRHFSTMLMLMLMLLLMLIGRSATPTPTPTPSPSLPHGHGGREHLTTVLSDHVRPHDSQCLCRAVHPSRSSQSFPTFALIRSFMAISTAVGLSRLEPLLDAPTCLRRLTSCDSHEVLTDRLCIPPLPIALCTSIECPRLAAQSSPCISTRLYTYGD